MTNRKQRTKVNSSSSLWEEILFGVPQRSIEFNNLAADAFNARLAQANLTTKTDFDAKLSSLNRKIAANKSKHLLVENELKKLKTFDSGYFRGKSHFEEDGMQNYLVFQPMYRYFKRIADVGTGNYICYWQFKGLSDERINFIKKTDCVITPKLNYYGTKARVEFKGSCFKQDKITFTHGKIINTCIVYEVFNDFNDDNYLTLQDALFGTVKLTKNSDITMHKYSDYEIGFDGKGRFSVPGGRLGCNVIIFGVDMSLSIKIDNRKKDILILGKGPTQGLEHMLSSEKMYSISFTELDKTSLPKLVL